MKEWNGFKEFGGAEVIEAFVDDDDLEVPVGTVVSIADIPGPNCFIVEIARKDDRWVGGHSFHTACVSSKQIKPRDDA